MPVEFGVVVVAAAVVVGVVGVVVVVESVPDVEPVSVNADSLPA